jgi:DNA-binding response OmpR family regulator
MAARHRGNSLRMLIVEADPHVADVLIDECEIALGAEVLAVETGAGALQALSRFTPTLALVEPTLPDMSGFEVARYAAKNDVPVTSRKNASVRRARISASMQTIFGLPTHEPCDKGRS